VLRYGNKPTPPPTRNAMDLAQHLSIEPHDDGPELTAAERSSRASLRAEYEAWRKANPFSDVLDWTLHITSTRRLQEVA